MKILVTGGAGFIGSHIVDKLIENGHDVVVVDDLSTGSMENVHKNAVLHTMDIRSEYIGRIFAMEKPDVIIHHAAQIDVQKSIKQPGVDADINIVGTVNILENCVKYGVKKIIYASSAAVYGTPQYLPVDEKHIVDPISYYGISKHTPEHYIKVYNLLYGLKYTILRYANVYGPRQDPKGEGGVVSIFTNRMLNDEQPTIFGDGEATRDYIYVGDIAEANIKALELGDNEIINVSTNSTTAVNELFQTIKEIVGFNKEPIYADERKGDIKHSCLDNGKAKELLGWQPQYSLEDGLRRTVEYYKNLR